MKTRTKFLAATAWFVGSVAVNNFTAFLLGTPVVFFTAPVVEEGIRHGVAEQTAPTATREQAMVIGGIAGLLEAIWKVLVYPTPDLLLHLTSLTSIPIHIALTVALYSWRSHRFLKNAGLHIAINLTLTALQLLMLGKVGSAVYSTMTVGLALVLCAMTVLAMGRTYQTKET